MSTEAQTQANRENAKLSTGPTTEAGKTTSSQNARRHGLTSDHLYVSEGQLQEFQTLYESYWNDICPAGEIQLEAFERLVHAKWSVNIASELHVVAQASGDLKQMITAQTYLQRWERCYDKALKAIREDQASQALRAIETNEAIAGLPIAAPIAKIAHEATKLARLHERTQWPAARASILRSIGQAFALPVANSVANSVAEPLPQAA